MLESFELEAVGFEPCAGTGVKILQGWLIGGSGLQLEASVQEVCEEVMVAIPAAFAVE